MRRVIKSKLNQELKEYLLSTGRFQKSDRIYVTNVSIFEREKYCKITVRKAFVKNSTSNRILINVDKFQEWVILKKRTEKILKIKRKIDVIKNNKGIKTVM